jgi:hypothetical protein
METSARTGEGEDAEVGPLPIVHSSNHSFI